MNTIIIAAITTTDIDGFAICAGAILMTAAWIRAIISEERFDIEERERIQKNEKRNRGNNEGIKSF